MNWASSERRVHVAKVAFEKYFLHKVRAGTTEHYYEKLVMKILDIGKIKRPAAYRPVIRLPLNAIGFRPLEKLEAKCARHCPDVEATGEQGARPHLCRLAASKEELSIAALAEFELIGWRIFAPIAEQDVNKIAQYLATTCGLSPISDYPSEGEYRTQ